MRKRHFRSHSPANLQTKLFGDKTYDSQGLQFDIDQNWGIELDAPGRENSSMRIVDDEKKLKPQIQMEG